ncbi:MAG: hypothetical protein KC646_00205 [Candidatus Cloacimonetes bacterium]|nr:hypothetical protein [Candidatus Cloacimonadota bacterium]
MCNNSYPNSEIYQSQTSFVGILRTGKYKDNDLELRNCSCGSTLATEIPKLSRKDKKALWEINDMPHYKKNKSLHLSDHQAVPKDCAKQKK